jgi:hypothetical protein
MGKSSVVVAGCAVVLLIAGAARAGESPPSQPPSGVSWYTCRAMINVTGHGPVRNYFYTSGAFQAASAGSLKFEREWRAYVQAQRPGDLLSLGTCSPAPADPVRRRASVQSWIDKYKDEATIVETRWTYRGP